MENTITILNNIRLTFSNAQSHSNQIQTVATFDKFKLAFRQFLAVRLDYFMNGCFEEHTELVTSAEQLRRKTTLTLNIISGSREK